MIRFKHPKLEQPDADKPRQIVLSETLLQEDAMKVVDDLIQQLGAHVVSQSTEENSVQMQWALNYGGAAIDLVYTPAQQRLVLQPLSTHSSCTLLDLHELFSIQSNDSGW